MKILDATCGYKGIYFQKNHPFVTFLDKRNGKTTNTDKTKIKNRRYFKLNPDILARWENLPFKDEAFDMIVFDPPHIIEKESTTIGAMGLRYGRLYKDSYQQVLQDGINELFRVLKEEGTFIFKWCERGKLGEINNILKLFPYKPLFGTRTGQQNKNYWIVFIKYRLDTQLIE